jgi:hypothetical protein
VQGSLPQEPSNAPPLICALDKEVKKVGAISDGDEAGKF